MNRPVWLIKHVSIQYDLVKDKLGSGNFCDVYRGKYVDPSDEAIIVAIKVRIFVVVELKFRLGLPPRSQHQL